MQNKPSSANTIMLIMLRISLILIATLATLMLTTRYLDESQPLGKVWLILAAISGCMLMSPELISLFRQLSTPSRSGKLKRGTGH